MKKPYVTRTLAPIHFEDLDPHRFEDLVRQLAYDFRQWQTIESTGRGGADDGFDIRAYEAQSAPVFTAEDDEEQKEAPHPMEGNLWMVQCKREKQLGPKRISAIIAEAVDPTAPPYGYILAAPANFSKAAHDGFRDELRSRGVMEFYLWGAGELEDMLFQPKNDHILFAFFGVSLATRRRSRTTDMRAAVAAKNKLLRILGDDPSHKNVLLRDLKDTEYPYEDRYADFADQPRWKEYAAIEFHPLGLVIAIARCYAYIDIGKQEWDFTKAVNHAKIVQDRRGLYQNGDEGLQLRVKGFWELLPSANRATFVQNGLIRYDAMALIDEKGDTQFQSPHIFVDFQGERGPFFGYFGHLERPERDDESPEGLKRVEFFPENFPKPTFGMVYKDKVISLDDRTRASLRQFGVNVIIYDVEESYAFLKPTDVIGFNNVDEKAKDSLLKITHSRITTGQELLEETAHDPSQKQVIERQIGRSLQADDKLRVLEAKVIYDWQLEQNRPVV